MPFLQTRALFAPCHMTPRQKKIYRFILYILLLTGCLLLLLLWEHSAEITAHWRPAYAKENLSPIIGKETLSHKDYTILYQQTGLGKPAIDALRLEHKENLIFKQQDVFFADISYACTSNSIISKEEHVTDSFNRSVRACPIPVLEDGDILLTASSHTFGWRNGHAALVVDADSRTTLESVVLGQNSTLQSVDKWESYTGFRLLRLKGVPKEERAQIAEHAVSLLSDIPYGLLSVHKKGASSDEAPNATHCAHLVWSAYAKSGYDLDSDGGAVVTPADIADSPLLETVQIYGYEP